MAAAKEWGQAEYARLDPFTITLPHPDAAIAIISRSTELAGHYGVSPFQDYELAAPGTHAVLKSYDTLGGPTTNGVVFMAKKFRDANPKVTAPGQTRADGIEGGETHHLSKGDVITVPANTPHWWKDTSKTGSVGYYAVNIEQ